MSSKASLALASIMLSSLTARSALAQCDSDVDLENDACKAGYALETGDASYCSSIAGEQARSECQARVAASTGNRGDCAGIAGEFSRGECIKAAQVGAYQQAQLEALREQQRAQQEQAQQAIEQAQATQDAILAEQQQQTELMQQQLELQEQREREAVERQQRIQADLDQLRQGLVGEQAESPPATPEAPASQPQP